MAVSPSPTFTWLGLAPKNILPVPVKFLVSVPCTVGTNGGEGFSVEVLLPTKMATVPLVLFVVLVTRVSMVALSSMKIDWLVETC